MSIDLKVLDGGGWKRSPASVSALLVLSLAGFASSAYALQSMWGEVIGYNESTVTVVADKQSQETSASATCRFDDVKANSLLVRNQSGNVITQTTTGSQVVLEVTYESKCILDKEPVLAIFEVRDSNGITNYVAWQNMTINSNE